MIKNKYLFILVCLFILLSSSFPFEAERSSTANKDCLVCHSIESECAKKIMINQKNFQSSAHGYLKCTDCHQAALKKTKGEIPHSIDLPEVNCTTRCHLEDERIESGQSPLSYPDSVHGKAYLERGVREVAKCWDCHTKHNIKKITDRDSTVSRQNIPTTCSRCHEDMNVIVKFNIHCEQPYQEYMQSVHGKALFKDGLLFFAAVCTDCHGVHNIKGVGEPHLMAKRPETCGKCHALILDEYKESIHGREALKENIDVPLCVDCHGEHKIVSPQEIESPTSPKNIIDTCSTCHARPEIMKKYGVPEDRIETFIESMHGIAIGYGYQAVANCTSCHGVHNILPASDPFSTVHSSNLAKTCGQKDCHPGMPEKIAESNIHIAASQKRSGALYYVQQILLWFVFIAVVITILWFLPGFIKKRKLLKKKK